MDITALNSAPSGLHAVMLSTFLCLYALAALTRGINIGDWTGQNSPTTQHDISGTISFLDNTTIFLENFNYDGNGMAVILYYYPPGGPQSGRNGIPVNSPTTSGQLEFNRAFSNEAVTGVMPAGTSVCDIQTLTVWCSFADAIFAQVVVNRDLVFVNGGSGDCQLQFVDLLYLNMVGPNLQTNFNNGGSPAPSPNVPPSVYPNCIPFSPSLQVSWSVDNDNSEIDFQMCGCISSQIVNQYMGFGLSGQPDSTFMVGADATIAWVDVTTGSPNAIDYYITGRFQCRGGSGVCPDTLVTGLSSTCSDDVRSGSVTGGLRSGGVQCVAFSRPFSTNDSTCDTNFNITNQNQFIVWAIGGLGQTAFIHFERADPDSPAIHLGRAAQDQCTSSITCTSCPPFQSTTLSLPDNATLTAYIGPSGQDRGYMAITGQAGWGIAWYINNTLIPVLEVQRGRTYTFIIEGGNDPNNLPQYHPFYITNSMNGGRLRNDAEERSRETVYAGFDGDEVTGVGRLCERQESQAARIIRDTCGSMASYEAALMESSLTCASGEPGVLKWTPDENTPDTVFYQCATHRNLGWKILVRDEIPSNGIIPTGNVAAILFLIIAIFIFSSFLLL